jgi:glutathione S-transferase
MYARARLPSSLSNRAETWKEMNAAMSPNMANALNWLDSELSKSHAADGGKGKFLVAGRLTAADIAMLFSLQLIYDRKLGLEGLEGEGKGKWKEVEKWMAYCQEEESWRRCVDKTGFKMGGTL